MVYVATAVLARTLLAQNIANGPTTSTELASLTRKYSEATRSRLFLRLFFFRRRTFSSLSLFALRLVNPLDHRCREIYGTKKERERSFLVPSSVPVNPLHSLTVPSEGTSYFNLVQSSDFLFLLQLLIIITNMHRVEVTIVKTILKEEGIKENRDSRESIDIRCNWQSTRLR